MAEPENDLRTQGPVSCHSMPPKPFFVVTFHLWMWMLWDCRRSWLRTLPFSVKCAEQTDPGITQRLDTLAVSLGAEPYLRSLWPNRCERVTGTNVSIRGHFKSFEVTTRECTPRFALSGTIFAKRLTKWERWCLKIDIMLFRTENSQKEKREFYSWPSNVPVNVHQWMLSCMSKQTRFI